MIGDEAGNNIRLLARSTTHRVATEGRIFFDTGAFGTMRVTSVNQDGRFQGQQQEVVSGADRFWILDASLGWRLPRQRGLVAIDVRNALNTDFRFQDIEPEEPTMVPRRLITVRVTFSL